MWIGALLALTLTSQAAGVEPVGRPDSTWSVPAAHAATFVTTMRLSLSLLWPRAYDPSNVNAMRGELVNAYSRPPDYRASRALFESDGDPWALNVFGHGFFGSEIYL